MARLADVQARLASIRELSDIVAAMRSLAAVRMRQAQAMLAAIRAYAATVRDAMAAAARLLPEPAEAPAPAEVPAPRALLVFATEHGFAGGFNDRMLDRAAAELAPGAALFLAGSRGALLATERGLPVAWTTASASHPAGVLEVARRIAAELYARVEGGRLSEVDVLYARGATSGAPPIERQRLLPPRPILEPVPATGPAPLVHLPAEQLVERLAAEYVLGELTRVAMESLAAENAARMHAMEAARENVERKLEQLGRDEHRLRQEAVTTELLDVITGAEALRAMPRR